MFLPVSFNFIISSKFIMQAMFNILDNFLIDYKTIKLLYGLGITTDINT